MPLVRIIESKSDGFRECFLVYLIGETHVTERNSAWKLSISEFKSLWIQVGIRLDSIVKFSQQFTPINWRIIKFVISAGNETGKITEMFTTLFTIISRREQLESFESS